MRSHADDRRRTRRRAGRRQTCSIWSVISADEHRPRLLLSNPTFSLSANLQAERPLWRARREAMHLLPHLVLLQLQVRRPGLSCSGVQCMLFTHKVHVLYAGIRLAGATSDVHIMDVRTGKWEKMVPHGEPPSPRAAHAAAAVGSMVVVQVRHQSCSTALHTLLCHALLHCV